MMHKAVSTESTKVCDHVYCHGQTCSRSLAAAPESTDSRKEEKKKPLFNSSTTEQAITGTHGHRTMQPDWTPSMQ